LKTDKKSLPVSSDKVQPEGHKPNTRKGVLMLRRGSAPVSKKYHSERLITNDLYLAAFLLCAGAELSRLEHNGRRRKSFVLSGEQVHRLRNEYESGTVRLNMRSFRESLVTVRRKMDTEQRSANHAHYTASLQTVPQFLCRAASKY